MYHLHLQGQSKMSKVAVSTVLCFLFNHINEGSVFLQKSTNFYQVHNPEDNTLYFIIQFLLQRIQYLSPDSIISSLQPTSWGWLYMWTVLDEAPANVQLFTTTEKQWLDHIINSCKRQIILKLNYKLLQGVEI
jgi:hypothetical protein